MLPAGVSATHVASRDASIYWVTDEPLLRYLGVAAVGPRYRPTHFTGARNRAELETVAQAPGAASRNRISVLSGEHSGSLPGRPDAPYPPPAAGQAAPHR